MTNLAHPTVNDTRFADLKKKAAALGRDAASGADARPKLALAVMNAACDGAAGPDNAEEIYKAYAAAQSTKAIYKHTDTGMRANVSKLRQILTAGIIPGIDGDELFADAVDVRKKLLAAEAKVKPAFDCFVDIARAQIAEPDTQLSEERITEICTRPEPVAKGALDKLISAYKTAYRARDLVIEEGTIVPAELTDAVDNLAAAIAELGGDVPAMSKESKQAAALIRKVSALGFSLQPAV